MTLELARVARNEHRAAVSRGDDPATLRKQDKAWRKVESARSMTFKRCAEKYIETRATEWTNPKHVQQWGADYMQRLRVGRHLVVVMGYCRPVVHGRTVHDAVGSS